MENLQFGQEIKMALKPKELETVEEEAIEKEKVTAQAKAEYVARTKIYYRDVALRWPSSDANAESPLVVEKDIGNFLNDAWKIEKVEVFESRQIGDPGNPEFVIPMLFVLSR